MLYTYCHVYSNIDKHKAVDIITIDYNKAFDKVNHSILTRKLSRFIQNSFINVISLLLQNRKQVVKIENSYSDGLPVTSGLPQGSILSPLLFNVFINDIFDIQLFNKIVVYADDLKLFGYKLQNLQSDLDKLLEWSTDNKMYINIAKCEVLHLGTDNPNIVYLIENSQIPATEHIKDLGLIVDQDLSFKHHTLYVNNKTRKLIGLLFKIFTSKNLEFYLKAYKTYILGILPIINYCAPLYGLNSAANRNVLERIQRVFTRRLYKRLYPCAERVSYNERLKEFSLIKIESSCTFGPIYFVQSNVLLLPFI